MKVRKKPVVIEARQVTRESFHEVGQWAHLRAGRGVLMSMFTCRCRRSLTCRVDEVLHRLGLTIEAICERHDRRILGSDS